MFQHSEDCLNLLDRSNGWLCRHSGTYALSRPGSAMYGTDDYVHAARHVAGPYKLLLCTILIEHSISASSENRGSMRGTCSDCHRLPSQWGR